MALSSVLVKAIVFMAILGLAAGTAADHAPSPSRKWHPWKHSPTPAPSPHKHHPPSPTHVPAPPPPQPWWPFLPASPPAALDVLRNLPGPVTFNVTVTVRNYFNNYLNVINDYLSSSSSNQTTSASPAPAPSPAASLSPSPSPSPAASLSPAPAPAAGDYVARAEHVSLPTWLIVTIVLLFSLALLLLAVGIYYYLAFA